MLARNTFLANITQLTIVNFYKVMIIFAPFCMLCLCTLLFFRVCHVCPECVDNMPPKKKIIPPANAYARLEEYVLNPPANEIGSGVGLKIRLGDIYHCVVLMTRDLNWTDVEVKKKFFLYHGGWGPADLMLIRQMTKAELDGLKEAFSQSVKLPSEQDFNTTFLKSLSKLAGRMTGTQLYNAISMAYNVFEGNHRLAALCILAMSETCTWCTWDFLVPCKVYVGAPDTQCRAVSALTNLAHYMARPTTVVDAISYVHSVMVETRRNRRGVRTAKELIIELKASGVHSTAEKDSESEDYNPFDNESTIQKLFDWCTILGDDDGVKTLEGLQRVDGQRLRSELERTGDVEGHGGRKRGALKVGGFLTWRELPCKKNKHLHTNMSAQDLLWLVNLSWHHWIFSGKTAKPADWLLFKCPLLENGKDAHNAAKKIIAEAKDDLAFIDGLADEIEEEKMTEEDALSVSQMSYHAIHGGDGRNKLAELVNDWHKNHPKTTYAKAGSTISGYTSQRVLDWKVGFLARIKSLVRESHAARDTDAASSAQDDLQRFVEETQGLSIGALDALREDNKQLEAYLMEVEKDDMVDTFSKVVLELGVIAQEQLFEPFALTQLHVPVDGDVSVDKAKGTEERTSLDTLAAKDFEAEFGTIGVDALERVEGGLAAEQALDGA